jgi:hypothetical protein
MVAILDTGQSRGQLAAGCLRDGPVEGADGTGDGGVHLIALGECHLQQLGQLIGVKPVADGAAENARELLGGRAKVF